MTRQQFLEKAKALPREERIDLVMDLWDDIGTEDDDLTLTGPQKLELDRRAAADEADPTPAEDWDVLRAKLLRGEF
jgi:putative addiction module component (TIGR02574 family)